MGALDDLAAKLGMDPLDFVLKNIEMTGVRANIYKEEMLKAAEMIEWKKLWRPRGQGAVGSTSTITRGLGLSLHTWGGGGHASDCDLTIFPDGSVEIKLGSQDLGTGTRTAIQIVVADSLGIDRNLVKVLIGSSKYPASGSSGGSTGSSPSTIYRVEPGDGTPAPAVEGGEAPLPAPGGNTSYRTGEALLSIDVPEDAKVYVNGVATKTTGAHRQYVSRNLIEGSNYTYEIRAVVSRNGKTIEETKTVNLRAGEDSSLAFDFQAKTETSVIVQVPADAKVTLAGHTTGAKGARRTFTTSALAEGETWEDYTIVVTIERGGRTVTQERSITLQGGDVQTVAFAFDGDKLAEAR